MDFNKIEEEIKNKYIKKQKHPLFDLYIYNYTNKVQIDEHWNEETMSCRGLITDSENNIISRPFKKFFNLSEHEKDYAPKLPEKSDFHVYEKLDGSLGISYFYNDEVYIATRGSFESEQAIVATGILRQKYPEASTFLDPDKTYLFEIIYPENKIVVDYGGMVDLVLLAIIDTKTGREYLPEESPEYHKLQFPLAGKVFVDSIDELKELESSNREGFVVKFANGQRAKVKFEEYLRLHKIVFGINEKTIWEALRSGVDIDELLQNAPDEFFDWGRAVADRLYSEYDEYEAQIESVFAEVYSPDKSRKEIALVFKDYKDFSDCLFLKLDGHDYSDNIWKKIKPKAVPYKVEV